MNNCDELIRRSDALNACYEGWNWDEKTIEHIYENITKIPPVLHEMSAREYVNARRRLCNAHLNAVTQCVDEFVTRCAGCLIEDYCEGAKDDVDEEIVIIEKWAREHPEERIEDNVEARI